jgi:hypothetical protein
MGSLISIPNLLFRGPAVEANKAGDGGLKGRDKKGITRSPTWETIRKVDNDDAHRSYADVCRAGVEQGKMSKLRLRHFAKQSRKAPKDRTV